MNPFDDMPDISACPHCGHDGEGLYWAFPEDGPWFQRVQCCCLACGAHGAVCESYDSALEAWTAGELEAA